MSFIPKKADSNWFLSLKQKMQEFVLKTLTRHQLQISWKTFCADTEVRFEAQSEEYKNFLSWVLMDFEMEDEESDSLLEQFITSHKKDFSAAELKYCQMLQYGSLSFYKVTFDTENKSYKFTDMVRNKNFTVDPTHIKGELQKSQIVMAALVTIDKQSYPHFVGQKALDSKVSEEIISFKNFLKKEYAKISVDDAIYDQQDSVLAVYWG